MGSLRNARLAWGVCTLILMGGCGGGDQEDTDVEGPDAGGQADGGMEVDAMLRAVPPSEMATPSDAHDDSVAPEGMTEGAGPAQDGMAGQEVANMNESPMELPQDDPATEDMAMDTVEEAPTFQPVWRGEDTDGDGLDDGWEEAANMPDVLNPTQADTDGDGVLDGDEDLDGDGLSCVHEQTAGRMDRLNLGRFPDPLRLDLLVEVDFMAGLSLPETVIAMVEDSFLAVPNRGWGEVSGIGIHFFPDQIRLDPAAISGAGEDRNLYLEQNGARFEARAEALDDALVDSTADEMLHLVVAMPRSGLEEGRGGEAVADENRRRPERAGIFLYPDVAAEVFPQCGLSLDDIPDVSVEEAIAGTLVHELGHALQLGHDTEVNGGVNPYNVMALVGDCVEEGMVTLPAVLPRFLCACMQYRYHGQDNHDPALGSSVMSGGSRFSDEAAELLDFTQKLGVDTAVFTASRGVEM